MTSHNFDFSPLFYYMEKSAKSSTDKYEPYATERAITIFTLQIMDEEEFLKTGRVISDPTRHAWYFEDRGVKSFDELMPLYAKRRDVFESGIALLIDAIYATLLMIALTQRQLTWDVRTKYHKILDFMSDILEMVLGNELFVALLCFAHPKEYQRFIPQIQDGMGFTKFCRALRASAWDLFLLRLPWLNLSIDVLKSTVISYPCCLSYICTTEHALRNIMSCQRLERVLEFIPEQGGLRPIIEYDLSRIKEIVGKDIIDKIMNDDRQWQRSMLLSSTTRCIASHEKVVPMINALETVIRTYCKPGT